MGDLKDVKAIYGSASVPSASIYVYALVWLYASHTEFVGGNQMTAAARLQKELMELMLSGVEGISAFPCEDNIFQWTATIQGAEGTAYEGIEYQLMIKFSASYPFEPPVVSFMTPCFHPNVDAHGTICLDILKENWTAVLSASHVLLSIQSLLDNPNNASPLNAQAAALWGDRAEYRRAVLMTLESRSTVTCITSAQR